MNKQHATRDALTVSEHDMSRTKDQARALLSQRKLRVTGPRLAVLRALAGAQGPISHTEVLERLGARLAHPQGAFSIGSVWCKRQPSRFFDVTQMRQ